MLIWIDRFDSLCPIACEWALAQAIEEACEVNIPKRTQYVRTVLNEINRLVWLTTYLGRVIGSLGQKTMHQQIYVLREQIFTIQEELTGGRILTQALSVGGVHRDLPLGNVQKIQSFIKEWSELWKVWKNLDSRLAGLVKLDSQTVEKLGWWGVVGKASGVPYDSRLHRPHGAYPFLDFNIISKSEGDAKARFEVATDEVELTLKLIAQIIKDIPAPPIKDCGPGPRNPTPGILRAGFYSGTAESAKGPIISCLEVSDKNIITSVRLFSAGQRVWPVIDHLFKDIRGEDFEPAFASLGVSPEDSEI
jgi:Ni,Fe-hydrogenase III large subunit